MLACSPSCLLSTNRGPAAPWLSLSRRLPRVWLLATRTEWRLSLGSLSVRCRCLRHRCLHHRCLRHCFFQRLCLHCLRLRLVGPNVRYTHSDTRPRRCLGASSIFSHPRQTGARDLAAQATEAQREYARKVKKSKGRCYIIYLHPVDGILFIYLHPVAGLGVKCGKLSVGRNSGNVSVANSGFASINDGLGWTASVI